MIICIENGSAYLNNCVPFRSSFGHVAKFKHFGTTVTNQVTFAKKLRADSFRKILGITTFRISIFLVSKNVKIRITTL
jgi:hypothetical protein